MMSGLISCADQVHNRNSNHWKISHLEHCQFALQYCSPALSLSRGPALRRCQTEALPLSITVEQFTMPSYSFSWATRKIENRKSQKLARKLKHVYYLTIFSILMKYRKQCNTLPFRIRPKFECWLCCVTLGTLLNHSDTHIPSILISLYLTQAIYEH